jgi:hypothetical protein
MAGRYLRHFHKLGFARAARSLAMTRADQRRNCVETSRPANADNDDGFAQPQARRSRAQRR